MKTIFSLELSCVLRRYSIAVDSLFSCVLETHDAGVDTAYTSASFTRERFIVLLLSVCIYTRQLER